MKDSLFEMLLHLFEKTLTQIKENYNPNIASDTTVLKIGEDTVLSAQTPVATFKEKSPLSMRVYTNDEQVKLTKTSYQFLMRIASWGIISEEVFELILHRLFLSESYCVDLQETKWTIRQILADILDEKQLAFLDLVLYHKEDALPLH